MTAGAADGARAEIERRLVSLFIAAEGAGARDEDRKKAHELAALLPEIDRVFGVHATTLVDAAAGKSYLGLLAAERILAPRGRPARVIVLERDPARVAACRAAAAHLSAPGITIDARAGDVADPALWPDEPDLVVALHACGPASDTVIDRVIATRARRLLLVPCCTSSAVAAMPAAEHAAETLGVPRHAQVRRRFVEAIVAAERTLRLEAAGWETEVVELVAPTVTPYNLLYRARRVGEPGRMRAAAADISRLRYIPSG